MQPPLFYAPPENRQADIVVLPAEESRHAARVLRLKAGTIVLVVDGFGVALRGELLTASPTRAKVRILGEIRNFGEPTVRLTLAAGLSTGLKFSNTVEKATELGVKRVVPLLCDKSTVRVEDRKKSISRTRRLERVALAAIKQCRRSYCPEIRLPCRLDEFLSEIDRSDCNLIFTPSGRREPLISGSDSKPVRATILIGPESGFSDDEVKRAVTAGFRPVSMGERILRTETAGPVACALVMQALGEFN